MNPERIVSCIGRGFLEGVQRHYGRQYHIESLTMLIENMVKNTN